MDKICALITRWRNFVQMYDILGCGNIPLCIYLKYGGMDKKNCSSILLNLVNVPTTFPMIFGMHKIFCFCL